MENPEIITNINDRFSPIGLFIEADIIIQVIIVILFSMSIISWTIIFERWMFYRSGERQWSVFSNKFWKSSDLVELTKQLKQESSSPFVLLFTNIIREYTAGSKHSAKVSSKYQGKFELILNSHIQLYLDKLDNKLSYLASISSTAPFIGLLGTVWGIMNAFQSIAAAKQSHLAIVAPGIAEALFATAVGLFAAIPASFAYNIFVAKKEKLLGRMDHFADDLIVTVLRHIDN